MNYKQVVCGDLARAGCDCATVQSIENYGYIALLSLMCQIICDR